MKSFARKSLYCLCIVLSLILTKQSFSQTSPLTFTIIPFSSPDLTYTPGRGAEQWHNANEVDIPVEGVSTPRTDVYRRYRWAQFENATQGLYKWDVFDSDINEAISNNQKFSFGLMSVCDCGGGDTTYGGSYSSYPYYLHALMQGEADPDWKTNAVGPTAGNGMWVPNWNSNYFLNRWGALNRALAHHIATTTSPGGVPYANVIQYVDIRGYGNYGEWHSGGLVDFMYKYPSGTAATVASQKRIIDSVVVAFPRYPLVVMIAIFQANDPSTSNIGNSPEIAHYALTQSNAWGKFGWRKDSYGGNSPYLATILEDNDSSYAGVAFDTAILNRYKYAPIVGEPEGAVDYTLMPAQVKRYHTSSFGNGNYNDTNLVHNASTRDSIRLASKFAGYRIVLDSGRITTSITAGANFSVTLHWKNVGLAPVYEYWKAVYELRNGSGTLVWSGNSGFQLKHFWQSDPNRDSAYTDNFTLPSGITAGSYNLNLVLKDTLNYRAPFPLTISGRNDDGSYTIKSITVGGCTPTAVLSNTSTCNGAAFNLTLSSATGASPYDLVINGVTYNDKTVSSTITSFTPPVKKVWTTNPSVDSWDDLGLELGVKFTASESGYIKGVRFFSHIEPEGTYTGHLWSSGGTLLATGTYSSVTGNAWQEVIFSTPVHISANTTYTASYHTDEGLHAYTLYGLSSNVTNGTLTALANGVFAYGSSAVFPTSYDDGTNYWVDVLFVPDTYTFNLTSVTDNNSCVNSGALQTLTVTSEVCGGGRVAGPRIPETVVADKELHYGLLQSYPNPAHDQARIIYTLPENTAVALNLYDLNGKLVRILVNGARAKGSHTVHVNAGALAKGVYYYTIRAGSYMATRKMVVQ